MCPLAEPTLTTERIHGAGFGSLVNTKEEMAAICQAIEAAGADALELRLGTFAFNEAQFINDVCFAGYGYDGTMSYGIAFDPKSNFQGILDSSHSGCGLIMGACRYVKTVREDSRGRRGIHGPGFGPRLFWTGTQR
mgnify:CR=1 FL=1